MFAHQHEDMVMLTFRESRLFGCRRRVFMLNLYDIIYKHDNVIRIIRNDILYFCIILSHVVDPHYRLLSTMCRRLQDGKEKNIET